MKPLNRRTRNSSEQAGRSSTTILDERADRFYEEPADTDFRSDPAAGRDQPDGWQARGAREQAPVAADTSPKARVTLGSAMRRYPMLVLLPVVVLVAGGVAIGLRRAPTYTATTQLNVGTPDANTQATPGFALAAETLASSYSREATSVHVYQPVSAQLGVSQGMVAGRISASAVPNSPTFYVNATGNSPQDAVRLANLATQALTARLKLDSAQSGSVQLLARFRQVQAQADRLSAVSAHLKGANAGGASISPHRLQQAQVNAQVAQLQAQALANQYSSPSTQGQGQVLDVLNPARSASSDRASITERYGLVGLAAGLVLGAALAFLAAAIRARRLTRAGFVD